MSTATPEVAPARTERVAIYVFPDAEELDFAGPWEVLSYWARDVAAGNGIAAEVVTVADQPGPVRAAKGLRVVPDTTWDELGPITVLLVPGGIGTRQMLDAGDPRLDRLRALCESGVLVTSVCRSLVWPRPDCCATGRRRPASPTLTCWPRWTDDRSS
jgi:transcriptional regulator GlxA family with amidase domain